MQIYSASHNCSPMSCTVKTDVVNVRHYLVVISVAIGGDRHSVLPQISLPGGDVH